MFRLLSSPHWGAKNSQNIQICPNLTITERGGKVREREREGREREGEREEGKRGERRREEERGRERRYIGLN
jgi:hypothetical protein